MKTSCRLLSIIYVFLLWVELGFAQKSQSEKIMYNGSKNLIPIENALKKKKTESVRSVFINAYADSIIFPNNDLIKLSNIEDVIVNGKRTLRKHKDGSFEKPTKIIIDIDKLNQLPNLKYLQFSFLDFGRFPIELCSLKQLKGLRLDVCFIDSLPKEISNLQSLEVLSIRLNNVNALPKEIVNLENLLILDLTNNSFRKIPEEIMQFQNLNGLNLANIEGAIDLKEYNSKWPFPVHINKIDYPSQLPTLINIIEKKMLRQVLISVRGIDEKDNLKYLIKKKSLLKKINWDIKE